MHRRANYFFLQAPLQSFLSALQAFLHSFLHPFLHSLCAFLHSFLASLPVINPLDVETIAIPKPLSTVGTSSAFAYTRNPGFEILFKPVITRSFFSPYFKVNTIIFERYFSLL